MQRSALLTTLLRSPPGLRSELARRALLSQTTKFEHTILSRGFKTSREHHRPRIGFIRRQEIPFGRERGRLQSTATSSTTESPSQSTPPRPSRAPGALSKAAVFILFFTAALAMSVAPAAETVNGYINPPSDEETLYLYKPSTPREEEVNEYILNHPLALKLREQPEMSESRPHMRIPRDLRPHNFTGGVLAGEGRLEVPPLTFSEKGVELPSIAQLMYFGSSMCGHPGIVHGGLLATMLDEGLARACFPALPNKTAVTASLKVDYRVPCPAGSYVVLKAYTEKIEGRKAWVKGWIELLGDEDGTGVKVVEAEALFIEPKNAKFLPKIVSE